MLFSRADVHLEPAHFRVHPVPSVAEARAGAVEAPHGDTHDKSGTGEERQVEIQQKEKEKRKQKNHAHAQDHARYPAHSREYGACFSEAVGKEHAQASKASHKEQHLRCSERRIKVQAGVINAAVHGKPEKPQSGGCADDAGEPWFGPCPFQLLFILFLKVQITPGYRVPVSAFLSTAEVNDRLLPVRKERALYALEKGRAPFGKRALPAGCGSCSDKGDGLFVAQAHAQKTIDRGPENVGLNQGRGIRAVFETRDSAGRHPLGSVEQGVGNAPAAVRPQQAEKEKEKELEEGDSGERQRTVVPHEVGEVFFRLRDDSFLPPEGHGNSFSGAERPRCFEGGGAGHPVLRAFCAQSARESRDSLRRSAAREFQRERHVIYGEFPEVAGHIVINLIAGRKETHMSRCPVGELIGMTASGSLTLRITHGHAGCIPFFRDGIRSVFPVELRGKHLKAIMAQDVAVFADLHGIDAVNAVDDGLMLNADGDALRHHEGGVLLHTGCHGIIQDAFPAFAGSLGQGRKSHGQQHEEYDQRSFHQASCIPDGHVRRIPRPASSAAGMARGVFPGLW